MKERNQARLLHRGLFRDLANDFPRTPLRGRKHKNPQPAAILGNDTANAYSIEAILEDLRHLLAFARPHLPGGVFGIEVFNHVVRCRFTRSVEFGLSIFVLPVVLRGDAVEDGAVNAERIYPRHVYHKLAAILWVVMLFGDGAGQNGARSGAIAWFDPNELRTLRESGEDAEILVRILMEYAGRIEGVANSPGQSWRKASPKEFQTFGVRGRRAAIG